MKEDIVKGDTTSNPSSTLDASQRWVVAEVEPEDDNSRFTAAGRPMPKFVPSSGVFLTQLENKTPTKFTDTSFISIPVPMADIEEALAQQPADPGLPTSEEVHTTLEKKQPAKESRFSGFMSKLKGRESKKPKFQTVQMMRGEYLAYFAKNDKGEYLCTVPRETGEWRDVLRSRLGDNELQESVRRDRVHVNGGTWRDGIIASATIS